MSNNNSSNEIPDIDGLKIINRLPGWRNEYDKLITFLIGPGTNIENYYLYRKASKCCYGYVSARKDAQDIIKTFVMDFAGDIACKYGMDKNGQPEIVDDDYDPLKSCNPDVPPFINYLTNSGMIILRFNSFWNKYINNREICSSSRSIISEDGETIEFLDSVSDLYCDEESPEECMAKKIESLNPLLFEFLDDQIKTPRPSTNKLPRINKNHLMGAFQLYPQITGCEAYVEDESQYEQDEVGWFHCHEPFEYDDDGLGRAIDETFVRLEDNKPGESPEKTMLECHKSSRRYEKFSPQNDRDDVNSDDFIWEVMKRCFAPINDSDCLKLLYGKNYQAKYKADYLLWIEENWFRKKTAKIRNLLDS